MFWCFENTTNNTEAVCSVLIAADLTSMYALHGNYSQLFNEVHLRIKYTFFRLHWEMKGHWSLVNLAMRFLKIYARQISFHFPMQQKKGTSILIFMLKRWKTPKKSKNQCHFFRHVTSVFHWKNLPQSSYVSLQANAMGVWIFIKVKTYISYNFIFTSRIHFYGNALVEIIGLCIMHFFFWN